MVPAIVVVCIVVCFFICYFVYEKKKVIDKEAKYTSHERNNIKLYMIDYAYFHDNNKESFEYDGFRKYTMFESMNKNMSILKSCLQQLIYEGIIEENDDMIKITKFGRNYYEKILRKK